MTNKSETQIDSLIHDLSSRLKPVRPIPNPAFFSALALFASVLILIFLCFFSQPPREGWLYDSGVLPIMAPEFLFALLSGIFGSLATHTDAVPGFCPKRTRYQSSGLIFAGLFLAYLWFQSQYPLYSYTTQGKRPHCAFESFIYPFIPALLIYGLVFKKRIFNQPLRSSLSYGLAIAMPMVAVVQVFCMYDPDHAIAYHFLPSLAFIAVIWGICYSTWRKNISKLIPAKNTRDPTS